MKSVVVALFVDWFAIAVMVVRKYAVDYAAAFEYYVAVVV